MTLHRTFRHGLLSERKIVRARRLPANFGKLVRTPFPLILFVLVATTVWYFAVERIATLLKSYPLHLRGEGGQILHRDGFPNLDATRSRAQTSYLGEVRANQLVLLTKLDFHMDNLDLSTDT
jgi:hypothetical protein